LFLLNLGIKIGGFAMKDRDEKGKFLPGTSGNPAGICKDGSIPVKNRSMLAQADVKELAELATQQREQVERIYWEAAPALMCLAIQKAKHDSKILAILIEPLAKSQQSQPAGKEMPSRHRNQLELELYEQLKRDGFNVAKN
jgi:hypothetical protein